MKRCYWLSFVDETRPRGQGSLGVCIVEVTEADYVEARPHAIAKNPLMDVEGIWLVAAIRVAWRLGCNPGGEVASTWFTPDKLPPNIPLGQLMQRKELKERGLAD